MSLQLLIKGDVVLAVLDSSAVINVLPDRVETPSTVYGDLNDANVSVETVASVPADFEPSRFRYANGVFTAIPQPVNETARSSKLSDIKDRADTELAKLEAGYPEREVKSWDQQVKEAEALEVIADAYAPLLRAIATARGLDVLELASRVRAKAAAFAQASGAIIGRRQTLEDRIAAVQTADELEVIQW